MAQIEGVQNKETCIDIYIKDIVIKGYGKRFKDLQQEILLHKTLQHLLTELWTMK